MWTSDAKAGTGLAIYPGDHLVRVTGRRFWWAWLNRPRFSLVSLTVLLLVMTVVRAVVVQ